MCCLDFPQCKGKSLLLPCVLLLTPNKQLANQRLPKVIKLISGIFQDASVGSMKFQYSGLRLKEICLLWNVNCFKMSSIVQRKWNVWMSGISLSCQALYAQALSTEAACSVIACTFMFIICLFTLPCAFCIGLCPAPINVLSLVITLIYSNYSHLFSVHLSISFVFTHSCILIICKTLLSVKIT